MQVRAKGASLATVRRLTEAVLPVTNAAGVWCVLNDHAELGRELGVPCVHLGQEDFFGADGSSHGGFAWSSSKAGTPTPSLGLSSHAPEQALRAVAAGADYVAVGPVFPTGTKPGRAAVTLQYVRWAAEHLRLPWFAIGGIDLTNLDDVLAAGARRICVVSAILKSADLTATTREFKRRLTAAPRASA